MCGSNFVSCFSLTSLRRNHLHSLFELIDKEIDVIINENVSRKFVLHHSSLLTTRSSLPANIKCIVMFSKFFTVKDRVETLEEILISSGQGIQPDTFGKNLQQQKQFSVSSVKRDSMVAGKNTMQRCLSLHHFNIHSPIASRLQRLSYRKRSSPHTG